MTNYHEILQQLATAFGIQSTDNPLTIKLLEELSATLLERVVTASFSYLSSDDQLILDGMLDAKALPEDVMSFIDERVPSLSLLVTGVIDAMKSETSEILNQMQVPSNSHTTDIEPSLPELSPFV